VRSTELAPLRIEFEVGFLSMIEPFGEIGPRKLSAEVSPRFRHTSSVTRRSQRSRGINTRSGDAPRREASGNADVRRVKDHPSFQMGIRFPDVSQLFHALVRRSPRCGAEFIYLLKRISHVRSCHMVLFSSGYIFGNCSGFVSTPPG